MRAAARVSRAGVLPWVFTAYWLCLAGLGIWSLITSGLRIGAVFVSVAALLLVIRCARLGVWVAPGDRVFVRDWLRSVELSVSEVGEIRSVGYSGFANRASDSHFFAMIEIESRMGKKYRIRSSVRRFSKVKIIVSRVASLLGGPGPGRRASAPRG